MSKLEQRARQMLKNITYSSSSSSPSAERRDSSVNLYSKRSKITNAATIDSPLSPELRRVDGKPVLSEIRRTNQSATRKQDQNVQFDTIKRPITNRQKSLSSHTHNRSIQTPSEISNRQTIPNCSRYRDISTAKDSSKSRAQQTSKERSGSQSKRHLTKGTSPTERWQREKIQLKKQLMEMEEQIELQDKRIRSLKDSAREEQKKESKVQSKQLKKQEEDEEVINSLHTRVSQYKSNEIRLMQEVGLHQQMAREAVERLYSRQEEYERRLQLLELDNRRLEEDLSIRERTRGNVEEVRAFYEEKQRRADSEIEQLKRGLNRTRLISVANDEKDIQIQALKRQVQDQETEISINEEKFREQLGKINLKIVDWQKDLILLREYEEDNVILREALRGVEEKLAVKSEKYKQMKAQWSEVYSELITQTNELRAQISYVKEADRKHQNTFQTHQQSNTSHNHNHFLQKSLF